MEVQTSLLDRKIITNVRVTEAGAAYHERVEENTRERDKLIDEDEASEVSEMVETCIELAAQLGEQRLVQSLKNKRDEKHVFEMSAREFEQHSQTINALLERLRYDYAFEFSKK